MDQPLECNVEKEKKKYGKYDNWEIKSIASDYIRVEECKKDSEKWKYVEQCLEEKKKEKKSEIKSIDDLLKVGEAKRMEEKDED